MPDRAVFAMPRRVLLGPLLLGAVLLGAPGCMTRSMVNAPPRSVVFFTANSADLDDGANEAIDQVARDAAANPARTVVVEGYATSIGTPATNQTLSMLRAQIVADALATRGVSRQRIVVRPRGATDADPAFESRRVEVSFAS